MDLKQQNTYSFQVHIEHSPGYNTCQGTKQALGKFKKIEIIVSIFSDHNTMRLEISYKEKKPCKKHKHMMAKQYAAEQPMDQ